MSSNHKLYVLTLMVPKQFLIGTEGGIESVKDWAVKYREQNSTREHPATILAIEQEKGEVHPSE